MCLLLCGGCGAQEEIKRKEQDEAAIASVRASLEAAEQSLVLPEPEAEQDSEEESTAEEPVDTTIHITISAAGDVTMGNYVGQGYAYSFADVWNQVQDPKYFLENVYDIFSADDMTIVNLEGPLTTATQGKTNKTYCISGSPEYISVLTEGSVEAVNMANNHHLDYYEAGNKETIEVVEANGIVYCQEGHVGIFETQGIRIGLVSADVISLGSGCEKYFKQGIEELQNEGVDLILASVHWGIEREYYPNDYQKKLGRNLIDWGCDLVIGHHPHVIQGIEEYNGKYIIYSLGNFCFGANKNPADKDCFIYRQTFSFEEGVRLEETEAKIIPCSISSISGQNDFKPTPAEGEKAAKILERMTQYSESFGVTFDENGIINR